MNDSLKISLELDEGSDAVGLGVVVEARRTLVSAARTVMLADNLDLSAVVQQVSGLRRQVQDRRSRIEATLRQETLANLQAKQKAAGRADRLLEEAARAGRRG